MALEYQIYLRDELAVSTNSPTKRKVQEIRDILSNIDSSPSAPNRINPSYQGFFVTYQNDKDLNFIFESATVNLLKNNNLISELARKTHLLRQVVISGVTNEIFSKSDNEILQELNQHNNSKVLLLSRFESPQYSKRYLFATLDSKVARDQIIDIGHIDLFQTKLSVHPPHTRQRAVNSVSHNHSRTYITPSAQRQGQALSSTSYWGSSDKNHTQGSQSIHPGRNHPSDFEVASETNDIDFKVIIEATSKICEVLSYGVENPKAYISLVNQSLAHRYRGFSHIFIPPSAIKDSRALYLTKSSVNPSPEPQTQSQTSSTLSAATITTSLTSTTSTPPATTITTTTNTTPISSTISTPPTTTIPPISIPPTSPVNTKSTATSLVTQSITGSSPSDSNHFQNPINSLLPPWLLNLSQDHHHQKVTIFKIHSIPITFNLQHKIHRNEPLALPHFPPIISVPQPHRASPNHTPNQTPPLPSHHNSHPSSTTTVSASCHSTPTSQKKQDPTSPAQCSPHINADLVAVLSCDLVCSPKIPTPGRAVYVTNPLLPLYPNSYTPTIQALDSFSANNYIH